MWVNIHTSYNVTVPESSEEGRPIPQPGCLSFLRQDTEKGPWLGLSRFLGTWGMDHGRSTVLISCEENNTIFHAFNACLRCVEGVYNVVRFPAG